ncbi:unnamed protein product [Rhizopus stolonifer]
MSDKKTLDYQNIFCGLSAEVGRFRLAQNGMGWKGPRDRTVLISPDEIKKLSWIKVARDYELRVALKNNTIHKFDGFKGDVSIKRKRRAYSCKIGFEELRDALKLLYKFTLETKEVSVKGWNWGKAIFKVLI